MKRPAFDFQGVTEEQQAFLKTAVAFEDLAVAAYKGQAHLIKSDAVLAAAVSIHSVEARHAAWMRHLFGVRPAASPFDEAKPSGGDPEDRPLDQVHRRAAEDAGQRRAEIHRLILLLLAGGAVSLAVVLWVAVFGGRGAVEVTAGASASLAALPAPALRVQQPVPLRTERDLAYWSPVLRSVSARASPAADAPKVALLATRTAEQTPNIVLTMGRATDARGRVWTRVRLPVLPNNTTGWVPRSALGGLSVVRTRLVVDLERLTATLYRAGKRIFSAGIGVGAPQWPTPRGEFYIRNKLASYASPFYGPVAFGTSARSEVLTDWPAGGFVGIHGTNRPELLPGRVSHGCIRMRNQDILRLARLLPVGTPLTIR